MGGTWTVEVAYTFAGPQPNGLAATPEGLWVCDQADDHVYLIEPDSGTVLHRFPSPGRNLSGMAAGGGAVYVAHNKRPALIFRHDPKSGFATGVLALPDCLSGGIHGIEWVEADDKAALWVTRPGLFVLDLITDEPPSPPFRAHQVGPRGEQLARVEGGELLRRIPFPAPRSHGIFFDFDRPGKNEPYTIVCNATGVNRIFRLDPADGEVLDRWTVEGFEIHGMTRDAQGRIWVCDAITNRIGIVRQ
jgi:streptogramin lyase